MRFIQRQAGLMTATSKAGDRIEIRKDKLWTLTIFEAETNSVMHTADCARRTDCCREACRYFAVGAFGDPNSSVYLGPQ
jgi:hypothetical protein